MKEIELIDFVLEYFLESKRDFTSPWQDAAGELRFVATEWCSASFVQCHTAGEEFVSMPTVLWCFQSCFLRYTIHPFNIPTQARLARLFCWLRGLGICQAAPAFAITAVDGSDLQSTDASAWIFESRQAKGASAWGAARLCLAGLQFVDATEQQIYDLVGCERAGFAELTASDLRFIAERGDWFPVCRAESLLRSFEQIASNSIDSRCSSLLSFAFEVSTSLAEALSSLWSRIGDDTEITRTKRINRSKVRGGGNPKLHTAFTSSSGLALSLHARCRRRRVLTLLLLMSLSL